MAKKKSNRIVLYLVGAVVFLIIFAVVVRRLGWIGGKQQPTVEIATVQQADITEKVSASGKIQPEVEVVLSPDVSGEITKLPINEGDSVEKGELLLLIRPDNYQVAVQRAEATLNTNRANLAQSRARVSQAEAQLVRAKANYDRNKELFEQKFISQAEYDQILADYRVAQQELQSARQNVVASQFTVQSAQASVNETIDNLSRTSIYAPMGGIVSKLSVELGERVVGTAQMAGTELLRIANLNDMEVIVDVNENDVVRISLGDTALVEVDAYASRDKPFKGVVTSIANTATDALSADAVTEFEVKVRILPSSYKDLIEQTNNPFPFRPGMTASVDIITESKQNILSVPISAVTAKLPEEMETTSSKKKRTKQVAQKEETSEKDDRVKVVFVYNKKNQKVTLRAVETGIADFNNIEIISGLKKGEIVVAGPFSMISKKLENGQEVKVENKQKK
ncbi:MAG: efflux RND transporter periplasmic adaptor subunit [Thermonemataceae bacterium]